jgi:hypothetical protein
MLIRNTITLAIILSTIVSGAKGQESSVRIIRTDESWNLLVNGEPFYIKGVVGNSFQEKVIKYGGNSVRMGSQRNDLDEAYKLGLKVLVNLPAGAERDGMNYNDTSAVRKQTERIILIVKKTMDHPAVLMWTVGNELDYIPPLKPFNPKVWDAVNQAAKAIHSIDPNHPVMTVIGTSMMWKVADIVKRCPDIDLLGFNTYGDIYTLGDTLRKYGWEKPYAITEWGPDGYWEVRKTPWNAPYEQTGLEKYQCYENKYLKGIEKNRDQCLGSFVFYWSGFKQETTHTWFCMFDENGLESPLVGLIQRLWTGQKPFNEAPLVDSMKIADFIRFEPAVMPGNSVQTAHVFANDRDGDKLRYKWEIRTEAVYASYAGQGEKVPEILPDLVNGEAESVTFKAPSSSGAYRLFVYVYDNNGHFSTSNLPFFVSPQLKDTLNLGRYISRTINLMHNSVPDKKNKIKILIYGQSISKQDWWLRVNKYVKYAFPDADIDMRNLSIGGFAAQLLYKTVEMDVSTFYPDLVLLHIYGDPVYYDSVLYTIRSRTAAEVAIMTDHYTGPNSWSDTMSYRLLPSLADKYSCEIINIRDSWKQYLDDHNLKPQALLKDDVHLNGYGNFIMAELVKQIFVFKPQFPSDPFGLSKTYLIDNNNRFSDKLLTFPFYGNRVVIKSLNRSSLKTDSLQVLVDGQPPSSFPGTYFMSRPMNKNGKEWPWDLPSMIRIRHSVPWTNEKWKCTFTEAEPPYLDFSFSIAGSVTGMDGTGRSSKDFKSKSGRIIITGGDAEEGGDWHLNRSFKVIRTTIKNEDAVTWNTFSLSKDYYIGPDIGEGKADYGQTLFQGIPNAGHILKLKGTGKRTPIIKEITVYRPLINN